MYRISKHTGRNFQARGIKPYFLFIIQLLGIQDEVEEEPEIVIAEVQSKIERLRNSVIELANMTRLKNKAYPSVVYEAEN